VSRFIDEQRGRFGVEPICRTVGVSASAYYQRASGERSARVVGDERLLERIEQVHAANYHCYGYRRTWLALKRAGVEVGRDRVKRLMRVNAIQGAKRRGKPWRTTTPDPAARRRPDLVGRDFSAAAPDRLWVADLSYLRCWEGLVFFAFVLDAHSRRVIGWQLASHMRTTLVLDALRMALGTRRPGADVALVHHSDRGSQYTSIDYTQELADHGVLASVGSVGDAYDNALAESFVDSFKTELIADRVWRSRSQLELAVVEHIGWFNHDRLHQALGDIPPVEFEQREAAKTAISGNGSVAALAPRAADRLYAPPPERERARTTSTALSGLTEQASRLRRLSPIHD
jgi:putative transposase